MTYNPWSEELPTESGVYAVALNGVLMDVVSVLISGYSHHITIRALHYSCEIDIDEFFRMIRQQEGWATTLANGTSNTKVGYDRELYPHRTPPLMWNKLNIPPLCYAPSQT